MILTTTMDMTTSHEGEVITFDDLLDFIEEMSDAGIDEHTEVEATKVSWRGRRLLGIRATLVRELHHHTS